MKLCIDMERHDYLLNTDLQFRAWVGQLNGKALVEIRPVDESLTNWEADTLTLGQDGKPTGDTHVINISTTPCEPRWLITR